jgi:hypothetical protein
MRKTTFSRWLASEHGYIRCPSGEEPSDAFIAEINQAVSHSTKVVVDWGIPTTAFPLVRTLIANGFKVWWFDGDRETALQLFLARSGHPATVADYRRYIQGIEENWETYRSFFEDRRLDVISPGPSLMSNQNRLVAIEQPHT